MLCNQQQQLKYAKFDVNGYIGDEIFELICYLIALRSTREYFFDELVERLLLTSV